MLAVCVTFDIKPSRIGSFMPLMIAQAETSLQDEPGCHRFDVCTDPDQSGRVFLYEIYTGFAFITGETRTGRIADQCYPACTWARLWFHFDFSTMIFSVSHCLLYITHIWI